MKFNHIIITILLAFSATSFIACDLKAPGEEHLNEQTNAKARTVDARQVAIDASKKVAELRDKAAKLRMTGQPEDVEKALKLEQEAAKLENEYLKGLVNQMRPQ